MSTETEIDRMKRIPIEEFLARLGHSPVQRRTNASETCGMTTDWARAAISSPLPGSSSIVPISSRR